MNNKKIVLLGCLFLLMASCGDIPDEVSIKPAFKEKDWNRFIYKAKIKTSFYPEGILNPQEVASTVIFVEEVNDVDEEKSKATLTVYIEKGELEMKMKDGKKVSRPSPFNNTKKQFSSDALGNREGLDIIKKSSICGDHTFLIPVFKDMVYQPGKSSTEEKDLILLSGKKIPLVLKYKVQSVALYGKDNLELRVTVKPKEVPDKKNKSDKKTAGKKLELKAAPPTSGRNPVQTVAGKVKKKEKKEDVPFVLKGKGKYYYSFTRNIPLTHTLTFLIKGSPADFNMGNLPEEINRVKMNIVLTLKLKED